MNTIPVHQTLCFFATTAGNRLNGAAAAQNPDHLEATADKPKAQQAPTSSRPQAASTSQKRKPCRVLKKAIALGTYGAGLIAAHYGAMSLGAAAGPVPRQAGVTLQFTNNCPETIWPATMSGSPALLPMGGGWAMAPGEVTAVTLAGAWQGRFWARTGCTFDGAGQGRCETGDCNGQLQCDGIGGQPPATLLEYQVDGYAGMTFYDLSLVDGYNLGISVTPQGGANCAPTNCAADINALCPQQLRVVNNVGATVACKSACDALGGDAFCCTGPNSTPATCPPTSFSETFKQACPQAYSYAYDDQTSTSTCNANAYSITFCPGGALGGKSQASQP